MNGDLRTVPRTRAPVALRERETAADRGGAPFGDGRGYGRRPDGAFPYRSSPLLVAPEKRSLPAVTRAFELAGVRWNLAIIHELSTGGGRFNAVRDALGISGKMLMRRLHMLLSYGIVERRPQPSRANSFEYHLTESGRDLYAVVAALTDWGERHLPAVTAPKQAA
jgi:DNA-binding HxlR family transcriptional regulator